MECLGNAGSSQRFLGMVSVDYDPQGGVNTDGSYLPWSTFRSIILFTASILCFMWRVGYSESDGTNLPPVPNNLELISRIAICLFLATGVLYGIRVVFEFRRYGRTMDEKWRKRVKKYIDDSEHIPENESASNKDSSQQAYVHAPASGAGV